MQLTNHPFIKTLFSLNNHTYSYMWYFAPDFNVMERLAIAYRYATTSYSIPDFNVTEPFRSVNTVP